MRSIPAVAPCLLAAKSSAVNEYTDAPGTLTVLIVDDDDAFRKQLRTLFVRGSGFDGCVEAQNAVEALNETKRLSVDLAVLSFSLPDMNGLELAQKLKAIASELPIFILTTDYNLDIEKLALSCAITAVFSKVDDLATLVPNARAACGIEGVASDQGNYPSGP